MTTWCPSLDGSTALLKELRESSRQGIGDASLSNDALVERVGQLIAHRRNRPVPGNGGTVPKPHPAALAGCPRPPPRR